MATAVLLPRDCFSPVRNKQDNGLEGVAHHRPESSVRSRRGIHHQDLVSRYGPSSRKFDPVIVTVDDSSHSIGHSYRPNRATMRKGNEGKRSLRTSKVVTKSQPEIPTYTILQRPKSSEPMDLNILKLTGKVETDGSLGSLETFAKKVDFSSGSEKENSKRPVILDKRNQIVSSDTEGAPKAKKEGLDLKTDKSKHVKGGHNTKSKFCWDVKTKPANVKTYGVTERTYQTVSRNPPQIQETNGGTVHKEVSVNKNENLNFGNIVSNEDASASGPLLLRRAFTDPQSIQCLATEMTKFEDNEAKYGSQRDITNNESYNEKWAGPAYSSSPAPSSLPVPKFTLSNMKVSSHRHITTHRNSPLEPLSQVNKEPSGIGSSVHLLPDPVQLGSYDAVLATRSLRRLLNLDS